MAQPTHTFTAGEEVMVSRPWGQRPAYKTTVRKVGRKYVHVGTPYGDETAAFDKVTRKRANGHTGHLYTVEEWADLTERIRLRGLLHQYGLGQIPDSLSTDQLSRILDIAKENDA